MKSSSNGSRKILPVDIVIIVALIALVIALVGILSGGNDDNGKIVDTNGDGQVTLADYSGKKIGSITGVNYDDIINKCVPGSEIMYYANYADMIVALKSGMVDAIILDEPVLYAISRQDPSIAGIPEDMKPWDMSFIFSPKPNCDLLLSQMNMFIEECKEDGTMEELQTIWFGDDESKKIIPPLTDLSGEAGVVNVALESVYEPIVYIKDKTIVGFEVDLLYRFCQKYNYSLVLNDMDFDAILPAVSVGKYDIGASGMSYNEEHAESVRMSTPHYSTGTLLAVPASDLGMGNTANDSFSLSGMIDKVKSSVNKNFVKEDRWQLIVKGIGTTCLITFISILAGSIMGFGICLLRRTDSRLANPICNAYTRFIQGIPMVILLMILFYVVFGKSKISSVCVATIGFTLIFAASASEIIQSGLNSIDNGQREAALALGYTDTQAFFRFLFPQAALRFIPLYCIEMITLLNDTSIVGYIAVQDVTKMSDIVRSRSYEAALPLITSTLIYFLLAKVISLVMDRLFKTIQPKRIKPEDKTMIGGED
ncbi:MAG: ABC transporter permease subunit [Lachnospiraceae bacterium]|nr:ABC transporter permease subunit [Lachnospiraceae bacterium]